MVGMNILVVERNCCGTLDGNDDEHLGWVGGEGCGGGLVIAYGSLKGKLIKQTEMYSFNCLNIFFGHKQAQ